MTDNEWRPCAPLDTARARAALSAEIRTFFQQRQVLEVETPVCSSFGNTDPAIDNFITHYSGPVSGGPAERFLQTSPEFPMKRLLAAGYGPIYQICKVFRNGESGPMHNPEFSMLEWYRPGFDHHALIQEVADLVRQVLGCDYPITKYSYQQLFLQYLDLDPLSATIKSLRACARQLGIESVDLGERREVWLDLLMTHVMQPALARDTLVFVYDYPASQAALARIRPVDPPVAERFELYLNGVELANGFHELTDVHEQRRRFEQELVLRQESAQESSLMDERLLAALDSGLPDCAGVALGLDRLLMIAVGAEQIDQVLTFPFACA